MKKIDMLLKSSSYFIIIAMIYIFILILKEINFIFYLTSFLNSIKPIWLGIILTFFVYPFVSNKKEIIPISRIILIYVIFILIILILFFIFYHLLVSNLDKLIPYLSKIYSEMVLLSQRYQIEKYINESKIQNVLLNTYEWLVPFIKNVIQMISTFIFSLIISFCLTIESHIIVNRFKSYVKNYEIYFKLYEIFSNILKEYVISTSLDILYIVGSTSVILFFLNTPYALLLAIVLAFFNVFPYIGALFGNGLIIAFHLLLVKENTLLLCIMLFINSLIESQIIHTWICKKKMNIHPIFLFSALLISEHFFGFIGIILSPIFASVLQLGLLTYSEYLNQKNIGGWENILS